MFGLFRKRDPHKEIALTLYRSAMEQSRDPWFFAQGGVPDSYDGRFDCLLLHLYLIIQMLNQHESGQALAQDLFDVAVGDFDQSLREIGVGDTGMKRRMKNMMLAFNGRMHAYQAAQEEGSAAVWQEALARNLYGTVDAPDPDMVSKVSQYVIEALRMIDAQGYDAVYGGNVPFPDQMKESE